MAWLALDHDAWARRTIAALAAGLYAAFATLPADRLAGVVVFVLLGAKVQFARDVASVRGRPRGTARCSPSMACLLPVVTV